MVTQGFVGCVTKNPKCNTKALWINWIGQGDSEQEVSVFIHLHIQLPSIEYPAHSMCSWSLCLMHSNCLAFLPGLP